MPDDLERKQDVLDLGADADIVDDQRRPIRRQRIGDDPMCGRFGGTCQVTVSTGL